MRPSSHLAASAAAGGAVWAATGEPWALPVTPGAGVLVDVDHSPDLWWTFALRRQPVAVFVLHGWEWLAGLIAFGIWAGFPWWLVATLVGYGLHLTTDHLFNHGDLLSYSLVYRARHGFLRVRVASNWNSERTYEALAREVPFAVWLIECWKRRSPHRRDETECETIGRAARFE